MSEQLYDIYFKGEALAGFENSQVQANVSHLFKASPEKIQHLFSGKVVALKKGLDKPTALKFQTALKTAGAKIYIKQATSESSVVSEQSRSKAASSAAPISTEEPVEATKKAMQATEEQAGITVLPAGSDVLTENERSHVQAADIDTSTIHLASSFALPEEKLETVIPPDVSHISAAEVGADILDQPEIKATIPAPDTSFIDLAEPGADLLEQSEEAITQNIDVSNIDLAEVGADMDPSPKKTPPPAPDTSHIHLD